MATEPTSIPEIARTLRVHGAVLRDVGDVVEAIADELDAGHSRSTAARALALTSMNCVASALAISRRQGQLELLDAVGVGELGNEGGE